MMKKRSNLSLINWKEKQRNGGKTFKLIESVEVSIQFTLGMIFALLL